MNLYIFTELERRGAAYGIGSYIRELSASMKNSDVKVFVIYLRSDSAQIVKVESDDGIVCRYYPSPISEHLSIDYQHQSDLYYKNIVYLLQLHIEDRSNLIFHLNGNQCSHFAEELKKKFDCRIVLTVHNFNWCFMLSGNLKRFRHALNTGPTVQFENEKKEIMDSFQKEKETFEAVDRIICVSEHTRMILQEDYRINHEKTTVIYNGLIDGVPASNKLKLRRKYQVPDIPVFIFAGRLENLKGLMYLLSAFRIVLYKFPHCQLFIAGEGSFDIFMRACEDIWMNVTWTGLVRKDKLYELFTIADIGVVPSLYESFGYVAVEMMMHGLPVITTGTAGLNEVADDYCGYKIPLIEHDDSVEFDTDLLAAKMLYMLENPDERILLGENARKRYEQLFSSDVYRRNMLNFYRTLF